MNSNKLKLIACISMLFDHAGVLLFPEITWLRYVGRLAMPIFAFFIAEGCRHTKNKVRYFLQIFILGIVCQAVYIVNDLINGGINEIYLNVLFTLALAIPLCCIFLKIEMAKNKKALTHTFYISLFVIYLLALAAFMYFCNNSVSLWGIKVHLDYGLAGILLCFFPVITKERTKRLALFALGTFIYCLLMEDAISFIWLSLAAIPLIALYNGRLGSKKLKWWFYAFYPIHFAVLYVLNIII